MLCIHDVAIKLFFGYSCKLSTKSENKKEKHLNMVIQIRFRVTNILFPDVYRILYYRRFACDIIENHSVVL